jgi:ferredoxin
VSRVLRLNPIACDAHGVCAGLLPEMITLDPWGYPVIAAGPVPADLEEHARRAVASCPTLALRLDKLALRVDKEERPGVHPPPS